MGLLSLGTPLVWDKAAGYSDHVRQHGITQFLAIWNRIKGRRKDTLLWGDEVEYVVLDFNPAVKEAKLSLRAWDTLMELQKREVKALAEGDKSFNMSWKPEYAIYMMEGTPGEPYGACISSLLDVEANMRLRRSYASALLPPSSSLITLTSPPMLGVDSYEFSTPWDLPTPLLSSEEVKATQKDGKRVVSGSLFVGDGLINPHPRFSTLTQNIRLRRTSKVAVNLPVFKDVRTPSPFLEPPPKSIQNHPMVKRASNPNLPALTPSALPDHVYMDAMAFGMGCCCLQITFQACSLEEARRLYDQLAVVSPIMLALTAASPIFRGHLVDTDVRWSVISGSVDDRSPQERGQAPLTGEPGKKYRIDKSRYDSISSYLSVGPDYSGGCGNPIYRPSLSLASSTPQNLLSSSALTRGFWKDSYNDIELIVDQAVYETLIKEGVDELMARHVSHLFIRDPLVIFEEMVEQDDVASSDHFENLQSTNWQTMRFKPPPPQSPQIGWRIEFRSMEVQLTDFENAAFAIFISLMTRVILSFGINLYIPISKVDLNMGKASHRDASRQGKFWFRANVIRPSARAEVDRLLRLSRNKWEHIRNQPRPEPPSHEVWTGIQAFLDTPPPLHTSAPPAYTATPRPSGPTKSLPTPPGSGVLPVPRAAASAISGSAATPPNAEPSLDFTKHCECGSPPAPRNGFPPTLPSPSLSIKHIEDDDHEEEDVIIEMTMAEIMNGKTLPDREGGLMYPGLLGLIEAYLETTDAKVEVKEGLFRYLGFIRDRANGTLQTQASFFRSLVTSHPAYQKDSLVPKEVIYDLCQVSSLVGHGALVLKEVVGAWGTGYSGGLGKNFGQAT